MLDRLHEQRYGVVCTSCGTPMTEDEIAWENSGSMAGFQPTDQGRTTATENTMNGGVILVGDVLCEWCYSAQYESGSHDHAWRDADETEDPWALDEDHEWYYPG